MDLEVIFLGTRGSVSTDGERFRIFGGATISVLVKTGYANIVFDAGSGFMNIGDYLNFDDNGQCKLDVFLSHTHFDHIMGLVASDLMFNPNVTVNIYGMKRSNLTIKEQIDRFMSPPMWPVSSSCFKANVIFHDISDSVSISDVFVEFIEGVHPGGSSIYKLTKNSKSLVYATDIEIDRDNSSKFVDFIKDTNLLICDGQYSSTDIAQKSGYGHSYWRDTVNIAQKSGCENLCIIHHDPYSDDDYLSSVETKVQEYNTKYFLAKRGERVIL